MRTCILALGAVLALLTIPPATPAEACSCASPQIHVLPDGKSPAPINTHIWVEFPPYSRHNLDSSNKMRTIAYGKLAIEVRDDKGRVVRIKKRVDVASGKLHVVELIPAADLRPATSYEVVIVVRGQPTVLKKFTTGRGRDVVAPKVKLSAASYAHPPAVCCNCSTGAPYVRVSFKRKAPAAIYGVWMSLSRSKRLDFTKPPTAYVRPWKGSLTLGHSSMCSQATMFLSPTAKGFQFGLVPMDLAGNRGTPMVRYVKSTGPSSSPRRRARP